MPVLVLVLICIMILVGPLAHGARAEPLQREPMIGGKAMSCRDFRGLVVKTARMTQLGDVGEAWIIQRMPIIALDPDRLARLPGKLQIFFYGHECAHHVLGHNFAPTRTSEVEADCWSVKHGRDRGYFTRDDVAAFAPHLARSRGSKFGHLPGPERSAHLLRCFDEREAPHAASQPTDQRAPQ